MKNFLVKNLAKISDFLSIIRLDLSSSKFRLTKNKLYLNLPKFEGASIQFYLNLIKFSISIDMIQIKKFDENINPQKYCSVLISKSYEMRGCLYTFTQNYGNKKIIYAGPTVWNPKARRPLAVRMRTPETSSLLGQSRSTFLHITTLITTKLLITPMNNFTQTPPLSKNWLIVTSLCPRFSRPHTRLRNFQRRWAHAVVPLHPLVRILVFYMDETSTVHVRPGEKISGDDGEAHKIVMRSIGGIR